MKKTLLAVSVVVVLLASGLTVTAKANGDDTQTDGQTTVSTTANTTDVPPNWDNSADYRAEVVKTFNRARIFKRQAHYWSHKRGGHGPWPGIHRPLRMTHSLTYEQWRRDLWKSRAKKAHAAYAAWMNTWNRRNRSIERAMRAAARFYGVSYAHLYSCSGSEGGHGAWKWNGGKYASQYPPNLNPRVSATGKPPGSSGAGGWLQFMKSTFYSDVANTPIPAKFQRWDSPVGQAYAAAWHFRYHGTGAWTGSGC